MTQVKDGLTVLEEFKKLMPNESFVYYADELNLPYGTKSKGEIETIASNAVSFLVSKNVKAIVIACGTVSALAYDYLKSHFDIPIFEIISPTIKNLVPKKIGIIATEASVNSHIWKNKILENFPKCKFIHEESCQKLVEYAENNEFNSNEVEKYLYQRLQILKDNNIDTLILGCTHFPLFVDTLRNILGDNVKLINLGTYSSEYVKKYLLHNNLSASSNNMQNINYYSSCIKK